MPLSPIKHKLSCLGKCKPSKLAGRREGASFSRTCRALHLDYLHSLQEKHNLKN